MSTGSKLPGQGGTIATHPPSCSLWELVYKEPFSWNREGHGTFEGHTLVHVARSHRCRRTKALFLPGAFDTLAPAQLANHAQTFLSLCSEAYGAAREHARTKFICVTGLRRERRDAMVVESYGDTSNRNKNEYSRNDLDSKHIPPKRCSLPILAPGWRAGSHGLQCVNIILEVGIRGQ